MGNAEVTEYYKSHQFYYSHFWSQSSLHYGLWYPKTRNLAEAITNADVIIAQQLSITQADVVLDAGCGVGGTSIFIAATTGARVEGITLSDAQLEIAIALAA